MVRRLVNYLAVLVAVVLAGGLAAAQSEEPQRGGTLTIALFEEPPTLDVHWSDRNSIRNVAFHINEGLFAFTEDFDVVPHLAESLEVSDDGLTFTIHLRRGVPFHNGQEMTATDVTASLLRWFDVGSSTAALLSQYTASVEEVDPYTVQVTMRIALNPQLFMTLLETFRSGAAIYPAEVVQEAGETQIRSFIGTGPYRLVEWRDGQDVLLERFEDYVPVDMPASGYAGSREAYVDALRFVFVTDETTRRVGVETGDFDVALNVSREQFESHEANPNVQSWIGSPINVQFQVNQFRGPLQDRLLRQAMNAAICSEELLPVYGPEQFWRLDPGMMWRETAWWSDIGSEQFSPCDVELARELVEQSGYDGSPIRILLSGAGNIAFDISLIASQLWQDVGINVELVTTDSASYTALRSDPANWELWVSQATYRTHPTMLIHLSPATGGWENADRDVLMEQLLVAPTFEEAYDAWEQLQVILYDDLPRIHLGSFLEYHIGRSDVRGYASLPEPYFWGVWLDR